MGKKREKEIFKLTSWDNQTVFGELHMLHCPQDTYGMGVWHALMLDLQGGTVGIWHCENIMNVVRAEEHELPFEFHNEDDDELPGEAKADFTVDATQSPQDGQYGWLSSGPIDHPRPVAMPHSTDDD